jgi:DNA-directed RNA polymerase specialized sigma subunit
MKGSHQPTETKELLLVAKLKNNRIVKLREERKLGSAKALADACGIHYSSVVKYENLQLSPVRHKDLGWKDSALQLAAFLGVDCEWLWPEITLAVKNTKVLREMNAAQSLALLEPRESSDPEKLLGAKEELDNLNVDILDLTPIEADIIRHRFNDDDETLDDVGERHGLSGERIRQLEAQALGKLRQRAYERLSEGDTP